MHVGMGLLFYPRGGSAQVAGYLTRALERAGCGVTLATGSLGAAGERGDAATFFAGLDLAIGAYDDAVAAWHAGGDPMDAPFPMHPSYEDREAVPDRCFTQVSPAQIDRAVCAWRDVMAKHVRFAEAEVFHLNHLSALHGAVERLHPDKPVITHLHGTDLKLLAAIERGEEQGEHAASFAEQARSWAARAQATIVISPHDRGEAERLLGLDPARVHWHPNGVDIEHFTPRSPSLADRREQWQRWLVTDAQGWCESDPNPGSVTYDPTAVNDAFFDGDRPRAVLMFVGRFLDFKRVPLLLRAYALAQERFNEAAPLVIWGGAPGEWEGDHPHTVAEREAISNVWFTGWRGHDELPDGLACADVFVAPSTDEPFGQVYLEAMSCAVPVIGTQSGGPPSFINVDPGRDDGWLVRPDDAEALADAMVAAINDPVERAARGAHGSAHVRASYSWKGLANSYIELYDQVCR